jgi:ribosomal protein L30/L7E
MTPRTKEQARAWLKELGLLKRHRTIVGEEREKVMTMLRLIGPGEQSNNQHIWTESWTVGNITYNLHTGAEFDDLEEITEEEV